MNGRSIFITFAANHKKRIMSTTALNNLWTYIKSLSLSYSDRKWLAEHLVEPEETERAKERKRDEEWVRELMALRYEGEIGAEEKKHLLRESNNFGLRDIKYKYGNDK